MDKRYFIYFRNLVDDYPEIVDYDTKEGMEEVLNRDYSESSMVPESSGSRDYGIKTENLVNGSIRSYYLESWESMREALKNGTDNGVENLIFYGRIEDEANS